MLVQQERTKPRQSVGAESKANGGSERPSRLDIDFRTGYYRAQLIRKDPARFSRKGTLSEYASEHQSKLVIFGLVLLSMLILIFVRNRGQSSALLCIQRHSGNSHIKIPYPNVDFKHVSRLKDKGKFRVVKADKWIVVAASDQPTDSVIALVRMQGWQVLAIGDTNTPSDWDVRGAIFLSVDQQALFGYRILSHLPYSSYVRKTVGYLFAIQHGAKVIYDADEHATILGGDLTKVFDIALSGPKSSKERLLQYLALPNRTVVNPYIHFGQISVWPRGFPLDSVSSINPEVYYGNIPSGKQFIQQGLANGFPDIDSVFYNTRKADSDSFNIKFDSRAPPVALPRGTMAPINNLNTLFHYQAFWSLMLPVSVNHEVSDIIRGYWAQRLLWEIGGYLTIYPPSIHRVDPLKHHSFEDEKDLHDNIDRLVEFLVKWTSKKTSFFERILDLSYSMAMKGFWTAQDVEYTAAWLQDLLSVGYLEPSIQNEKLQPSFGHSNQTEFMSISLPSIHLGVDEASTVGFAMGNLIRWKKFYGDIVLIMECTYPVNHTALAWRMLYGRMFKRVVLLSSKADPKFGVQGMEDQQPYKLLSDIFVQHSDAEGFLFMKDYVILNYWNVLQANKTKLWNLHKINEAWRVVSHAENGTEWYHIGSSKKIVRSMVKSLPVHFRIAYRENIDDKHFVVSNSDIFYIPQRLVQDFGDLVNLAVQAKLRQELAIPLFFLAMDRLDNFDSEAFSNVVYKADTDATYAVDVNIVRPIRATNELELLTIMKTMASGDPLLLEVL